MVTAPLSKNIDKKFYEWTIICQIHQYFCRQNLMLYGTTTAVITATYSNCFVAKGNARQSMI